MSSQIFRLYKGDALTVRLNVVDLNGNPFNLTGYECAMTMQSSPVMSWDTSDPSKAKLIDPAGGQVEFYLLSSQTDTLSSETQYATRMTIKKDDDHVYTIMDGFADIL